MSINTYFKTLVREANVYSKASLSLLSRSNHRDIKLVVPSYVTPQKDDIAIAERILASYQKALSDSGNRDPRYQPSVTWKRNIAVAYEPVHRASEQNDPAILAEFLVNIGQSPVFLGFESTPIYQRYAWNPIGRQHIKSKIFRRQLDLWDWYWNGLREVSVASQPNHGNLPGALIDGEFYTPWSLNYYNIADFIVRWAKPNGKVSELGIGNGKLAYYLFKRSVDQYYGFDLPEVVCVAAYYLLKCFPNSGISLYGEQRTLINLLPAFCLEDLENTDIFVNKNSLGEMASSTVDLYVQQISRTTNTLIHINHEFSPAQHEGELGVPAHSYPIEEARFRHLVRYPDFASLSFDGWNLKQDIFINVYQRSG